MILTEGQASEYTCAKALIEGFNVDYVLADKGYDGDSFVYVIVDNNAVPVIPAKRNRKTARDFDKVIYKEGNLVEASFRN